MDKKLLLIDFLISHAPTDGLDFQNLLPPILELFDTIILIVFHPPLFLEILFELSIVLKLRLKLYRFILGLCRDYRHLMLWYLITALRNLMNTLVLREYRPRGDILHNIG